jgi:hypothetical protein
MIHHSTTQQANSSCQFFTARTNNSNYRAKTGTKRQLGAAATERMSVRSKSGMVRGYVRAKTKTDRLCRWTEVRPNRSHEHRKPSLHVDEHKRKCG